MAQAAHSARRRVEAQVREPRPARSLSVVSAVQTDIRADPDKPTVGVHPAAITIGLAAAVWFVAAAVLLFATGDAFNDYLLVIVAGFALVFFGLTLLLARRAARDKRWSSGLRLRFGDFVDDAVAIETGTIAAREAVIQIITLPIVLAAGMTAIGIVLVLTAQGLGGG